MWWITSSITGEVGSEDGPNIKEIVEDVYTLLEDTKPIDISEIDDDEYDENTDVDHKEGELEYITLFLL